VAAAVAVAVLGFLAAFQPAEAVTVTPIEPPAQARSLGDAGSYVRVVGTDGELSRVVVPVVAAKAEWLAPETLGLSRLNESRRRFEPVESSWFDSTSGSVIADVRRDGIYGVFGLSRARHVAQFQRELCQDAPAEASPRSDGEGRVMPPSCRVILCAEVDVDAWLPAWARALGRSLHPIELQAYVDGVCSECLPRELGPEDFPECAWIAQLDESLGQSTLIAFPCPGCARVCLDFDRDTVCDAWEICHGTEPLAADTDSDALPDGEELDWGTDPTSADTDGDGLLDGWEVHGYDADGDGTTDVDLSALGVSPLRRDLLVELAWLFLDNDGDGAQDANEISFEPSPGVISDARKVFDGAPTGNPDGSTGVNLIVSVAAAGLPLLPGVAPEFYEVYVENGVEKVKFTQTFSDFKAAYADQAILDIARYSLWVERLEPDSTASGLCEDIVSKNFLVSVGFYRSTGQTQLHKNADNANLTEAEVLHDLELSTFLHELGHTLGLYHGGSLDPFCGEWERRFEPNYPSVMNYFHQKPGLDGSFRWGSSPGAGPLNLSPVRRCAEQQSNGPPWMCFVRGPTRVFGYRNFSVGALPPIEEGRLDESAGLPPVPGLSGSFDFDGDGAIVPGAEVSADLNDDGCDDEVLTDHDDWAAMVLRVW
jgi:hypothetical protein